MSDDPKAKPSPIPSWQQGEDPDAENQTGEHHPVQSDSQSGSERSRVDLKEQAMKFLEDEQIRDAPLERKAEFLEMKGLSKEEVHGLLGEWREVGSKGATSTIVPKEGNWEGPITEPPDRSNAKQPPSLDPSPSQPKETPPIITYPEFLLHSQKPPPLITAQRLLTAVYVASGAAALTYGTSKYVVEPMVESLTAARHSFAEHTIEKVNALNEKLEGTISVLPDASKATLDSTSEGVDDVNASSFFQRSAATQTSPRLSRSNSTSSSSSVQQPSAIDNQCTRLQKTEEDLQELCGMESGRDTKQALDTLQTYLSALTFGGSQLSTSEQRKEDGISKLKAEIRQTKGVLLSSRNFPSSVAARGWGNTAS